MAEACYTVVRDLGSQQISVSEAKTNLEKGTDDVKIDTMRKILITMLNGDSLPQLLMDVIRFVMPSKNKELKRLLHFYWEICPKTGPDGKPKQEMLLVCNGLLSDLQHPNEYVRGATLRFLCKVKEHQLFETLLPACRACLEHRHAYVRKNAVFAIYSIHSHSPELIPDAAELIETFLQNENDATCKRNAFVALADISPERALAFFNAWTENVIALDELHQLAVLQFISNHFYSDFADRAAYLSLVADLLDVPSSVVSYEAATVLTKLSSTPSAVSASASKFISACLAESDNNVKLIILSQIDDLRERNPAILEDLTMDVLQVLSTQDKDVREKALNIALELVSSRNAEEVVMYLRKEMLRLINSGSESDRQYSNLLLRAIFGCAIRFGDIAKTVVDLIVHVLPDLEKDTASETLEYLKELVDKFDELRPVVVKKLTDIFSQLHCARVLRGCLWILGEFSATEDEIRNTWKVLHAAIGEVPLLATETKAIEDDSEPSDEHKLASTTQRVLSDGTYATESAFISGSNAETSKHKKLSLRHLILKGDFYVASVFCSTLTKLVLRFSQVSTDQKRLNSLRSQAMLIMISIARLGKSSVMKEPIDEDTLDRIITCFRALRDMDTVPEITEAFLDDSLRAFHNVVKSKEKDRNELMAAQLSKNSNSVSDLLVFRQFSGISEPERVPEAYGSGDDSSADVMELQGVVPLTGYSDPIYAEASIRKYQFDIYLDILMVNQTMETKRNVTVDLEAVGDLKILGNCAPENIGPHDFHSIQMNVKVNSAETGVLFGTITYDGVSANDIGMITLNDVQVDIMDYIHPGSISDAEFRSKWTEFEWENNVDVTATNYKTLYDYLQSLQKVVNMQCLTSKHGLQTESRFLSANLYAQSSFGDDALANVSLQREDDGSISGHIRVRCKSQGLALLIGEKISASKSQAKK
ncbi:hypothetical protein CANCADRAFT_84497 [Tortispora caseinolytica NRRL Y-17796]|uniref:Coatomer subunit beta n=1 Tax=Tortispora caseinolytica NRRL Y-17796 TaxID=767744 RepID=A0A1E4TKJ2_9ASCO|nr:hypothetical protein CANCADRAFT_84497 [Tortispora caseinolytica NRRL Y-17796]